MKPLSKLNNKPMFEFAIGNLYSALTMYAAAHKVTYESPIGEDYVLGPQWLHMVSGLTGLLNGETGNLDCGLMDRKIRQLARDNGFSEKEIDQL